MLSFFKRNKKAQGQDSAIDSKELLGETAEESTDVEVETTLHLHSLLRAGNEEKYYYQFLNNELPKLKENQLSLSGIELKSLENGQGCVVTAFIRNSLKKAVKFEELPLLLIGPNGEKLARREFNLAKLGELPALSSTPWMFVFEKKHLHTSELPTTGWKLAFELKKQPTPHSLDLAESWENSLASTDKEKLTSMVNEMTPPKPGEINFMGLQIKTANDGNLHITMLIRNGSEKNINLQKLPLVVEDATGEVVASGGFALESFEVKANTSKPWTFIFPKALVQKEDADFSKWRAYPPQNQKK